MCRYIYINTDNTCSKYNNTDAKYTKDSKNHNHHQHHEQQHHDYHITITSRTTSPTTTTPAHKNPAAAAAAAQYFDFTQRSEFWVICTFSILFSWLHWTIEALLIVAPEEYERRAGSHRSLMTRKPAVLNALVAEVHGSHQPQSFTSKWAQNEPGDISDFTNRLYPFVLYASKFHG